MRFLVPPETLHLGPAAWLFLAAVGLALPLAAVSQHRRRVADRPEVTRAGIYVSALITHAGLLLLTWLVVRGQPMPLLASYRPDATDLGIGVASLAIGLVALLPRFRQTDPEARRRTRMIAPRTPGEYLSFYLVAVSAGVSEQLAYRGVLFLLLAALAVPFMSPLAAWIVAALASALVFGIVHVFQGWKNAALAGLIGLRDQIVIALTGTMFVAIVVHAVHDITAGTVIGRRERDVPDVPPAPAPAPGSAPTVPAPPTLIDP